MTINNGAVYFIPSKVTCLVVTLYDKNKDRITAKLSYINNSTDLDRRAMKHLEYLPEYFINNKNIFFLGYNLEMTSKYFESLKPVYLYTLEDREYTDLLNRDLSINKNIINYINLSMFSELFQAKDEKECKLIEDKWNKIRCSI